jgi:2-hydroxy-3-keto-5-methylthiopentenyl-1-phosphate phosphatase
LSKEIKTLVQCDFDGTITEEDVSFMMLDAYAGGDWRKLFQDYEDGIITVGRFNTEAFAMVKANRQSLLDIVMDRVKIRPGFPELVECCRRKNYNFTIVSNGLDFYIEEILKSLDLKDIEVHAARTDFKPEGLAVQYVGPDGIYLDNSFKLAYVNSFLNEDYRIIYAGNGNSDFEPAKQCHDIFATGALLKRCKETNTAHNPFNDLNEITKVLESWN